MQQEAEHASIALQGALVRDVVLPNLVVFGPLVYLVELAIAVSLLLGPVLPRRCAAGSADGPQPLARTLFGAQRVALDLHVPGHDPGWFAIDPPGRALGADALLRRRAGTTARLRRPPVLGELNGRSDDDAPPRSCRLLALAAAATPPARQARDLSLACDTTLAPALRAVGCGLHRADRCACVRLPHRARADPAATRARHPERHRGHAGNAPGRRRRPASSPRPPSRARGATRSSLRAARGAAATDRTFRRQRPIAGIRHRWAGAAGSGWDCSRPAFLARSIPTRWHSC